MNKRRISVIIPAGGDGIRFKKSGYNVLKPFIVFNGMCMFEHLIRGFHSIKYDVQIIIIVRDEFKQHYWDLISSLESKYSNVKFKYILNKTEGTTATALHLFDDLNNNDMLLLANCDQIVDVNLDEYIDNSLLCDGSLLVFDNETSDKWSFVEVDENYHIKKVVAKMPISTMAVSGWYFWTKSSDFIKYGIMQIVNQDKVKNEYYLCPCFNYAINDHKIILAIVIDKSKMHGVGTPDDLLEYINSFKS